MSDDQCEARIDQKYSFKGTSIDDHARAVTPAEAISLGADYIVIGRAIMEAKKPEVVLDEIIISMF